MSRKTDKATEVTPAEAIEELASQVSEQKSIKLAVKTLISGIARQLDAAIEAATSAGSTADQLEILTALSAALEDGSAALINAIPPK